MNVHVPMGSPRRSTPAPMRSEEELARRVREFTTGLAQAVYPGRYNGRGREVDLIAQRLDVELPKTLRALALEVEGQVKR
jgi:hypothetical protein